MAPKVFISHADEDKARFVIDLATKLRASEVDAWLDKWEMLPGDSIVTKIFEEGLDPADVVIIVISKYSIKKPWVREEIDAAFIRKIKGKCRIIPVIIDDCEVPSALEHLLWQKIDNLDSYQEEFKKILASIFDSVQKPPLGSSPEYAQNIRGTIGGLTNIESLILLQVGRLAMKQNLEVIGAKDLQACEGLSDLPASKLSEYLEVLEHEDYLRLEWAGGGDLPSLVWLSILGFNEYAWADIEGYEHKISGVVSALVNKKQMSSCDIAGDLGVESLMVDFILKILALYGHLTLSDEACPYKNVLEVHPTLKRLLD